MADKKKIKILLVDEDEFIQIFFRDVFWMHGQTYDYEVFVAPDLDSAKKMVEDQNTKPDVIFLDLMIPQTKGGPKSDKSGSFEFLKSLKANLQTKDIEVAIFSGFSDKELVKKASELGAKKFLIKGELLPQDLVKITEEVLLKK